MHTTHHGNGSVCQDCTVMSGPKYTTATRFERSHESGNQEVDGSVVNAHLEPFVRLHVRLNLRLYMRLNCTCDCM